MSISGCAYAYDDLAYTTYENRLNKARNLIRK